MKILLFSDIHWNTTMSLVRSRGKKYSTRLEHLIKSINWVELIAYQHNCEQIYCLGDFFDKPTLTDEELTALKDIIWTSIPHYFLVGNHESSVNGLTYNSTKALESPTHTIIDTPCSIDIDNLQINLLPYILDSDKQPLNTYFDFNSAKTQILFSHIDIAGINYAGFESKLGFTVEDLENNFDLIFNGHLHNSKQETQKILNIGSLSAHNFTNDSLNYQYGVWIFDTSTLEYTFIENPYGFNFYKYDILTEADFAQLDTIKQNAVLSLRCKKDLILKLQSKLSTLNIIDSRISVLQDTQVSETELITISNLQTDHLAKFIAFCRQNILNASVLEPELAEICKQ